MHVTDIYAQFMTAHTTFGNNFEFFLMSEKLPNVAPNIADVRDIGSLELGLALGVSGVVGKPCFEVGGTHWSGLGAVFWYRGGLSGRMRKSTMLKFSAQWQKMTKYPTLHSREMRNW